MASVNKQEETMSDIQRWEMTHVFGDGEEYEMLEDALGGWVDYYDHLAAMQAKDEEIAALRARLNNATERQPEGGA